MLSSEAQSCASEESMQSHAQSYFKVTLILFVLYQVAEFPLERRLQPSALPDPPIKILSTTPDFQPLKPRSFLRCTSDVCFVAWDINLSKAEWKTAMWSPRACGLVLLRNIMLKFCQMKLYMLCTKGQHFHLDSLRKPKAAAFINTTSLQAKRDFALT